MKKSETHSAQKECRELLIFLLVTYGIPYLMIIPMAILTDMGKKVDFFVSAQMFCPAAGLLLAKLLCDKDKRCMPKNFFIGYLVLTGITLLWCFTTFFLPFQQVSTGGMVLSIITALVFISVYLSESNDARSAYGLKSKNWKLSVRLLILFVVLHCVSLLLVILLTATGNVMDALRTCFSQLFQPAILFLFLYNFHYHFGEEYGWRSYFQPLLQKKFGIVKGVLLFGVLWELWHLPMVIFFFAPWVSMTSPIELVQAILGRLISTTILGIFIAYAYMRTNNVWLPVIIHFLHNSIVMLSLMNFASMEVPNGGVEYWHIIFVYVLILMVFFTPLLFSKVFRSKI